MKENTNLYIVWTNDNPITAEKMVFMYGINSKIRGWWENVTIIIWGATAPLVAENKAMQDKIKEAQDKGVHIMACKACAEQLGVTEDLEALGIEVDYTGELLTDILKSRQGLITI